MAAETVICAFSVDHVGRITGLSPRQLSYWNGSGFFKPSLAKIDEDSKPMRIYSFDDVVGLRVIAVLLKQHKISIQQLRKVAEELSAYTETPWSSLKLMVCKKEVSFVDPKTGHGRGVLSGQGVLMPIIDQIHHVKKAAADLNERARDKIGAVERHRNVVHNVHVFAGTRVPVRAVERFLAAGFSIDHILSEYPSLERGDIEAIQREKAQQAAA